MTTFTANTLARTYRCRTPDEVRKVEAFARRAGLVASEPRLTAEGWEVTLSCRKDEEEATTMTAKRENWIARDIAEAFAADIDITVEKVLYRRTNHAVGYTVWDYATESDDPMVRHFIENLGDYHKTRKAALAAIDEVRSKLVTTLTIHCVDDLRAIYKSSPGLDAMVAENTRRCHEAQEVAS